MDVDTHARKMWQNSQARHFRGLVTKMEGEQSVDMHFKRMRTIENEE
jgi:hypothetical protein